jgi:Kef-type K+ transport system membrane component KefB
LTELKLLNTPVGVIVLSAGVGNDVTGKFWLLRLETVSLWLFFIIRYSRKKALTKFSTGWILLALCVALVNAGTGLTALYVLLTCVGYTLFLVFAVRPAFLWILTKNRSLQDGPSQSIVALTLLLALTSAFFTGVIGIHPIFGAFLVGIICPHDGGFAIKVTEKVEDLISALFLPLYFALSGLSTNLGLLNSGIVWAYVIGIIAVAFFGKFIGASLAARASGMVWRESLAIGSLMSCKGLVELIVLV